MNTTLLSSFLRTHYQQINYRLFLQSLIIVFMIVLFSASEVLAQKNIWRYVATLSDGNKGFLNDEIKILADGNKRVWEKLVMTDGAFAIALADWDCKNKLRLTRQITFYKSDQTVIGTTKKPFEWTEVIPGSASDFIFSRVCLASKSPKWAEITTVQANLRSFPSESAPVIKVAQKGNKFQIVTETGNSGWYNIVDVATQQDYWLHGNTFRIVEPEPVKQKSKRDKSTSPKARPKSKSKIVKNNVYD